MRKILVDGENLNIEDIVSVARDGTDVEISEETLKKLEISRELVERWVKEGKTIYGVTTGFGSMCNIVIHADDAKELQKNLIRSHSIGAGEFFPTDIVRASMLIRANTLAKGYSGIKEETLRTLVEMIRRGVHPRIPEKGSVGASGDLDPLSHMASVMIGRGYAEYDGEVTESGIAMKNAGINLIELGYKEGLALINGTSIMTAIAALVVHDAENLIKVAEISAALSLEALCGFSDPFEEKGNLSRPHPGQIKSATNMRRLIEGSKLVKNYGELIKGDRIYHGSVQDAYSLRCSPQVLGPVREMIDYSRRVIEIEMNSATDNPLIFQDGSIFQGGNFHGQPIALISDFLGIALSEIGIIAERRIARVLDRKLSKGLPCFLISREEGLRSGFMGIQYLATSLVAENKILVHPASTESIPTNANNQDVVSMGTIAARKAMEILRNVETIVGIELLCSSQAIYLRGEEKLGRGTKVAYKKIRAEIPPLEEDREMHGDLKKIVELIRRGTLVNVVEENIKKL